MPSSLGLSEAKLMNSPADGAKNREAGCLPSICVARQMLGHKAQNSVGLDSMNVPLLLIHLRLLSGLAQSSFV